MGLPLLADDVWSLRGVLGPHLFERVVIIADVFVEHRSLVDINAAENFRLCH